MEALGVQVICFFKLTAGFWEEKDKNKESL